MRPRDELIDRIAARRAQELGGLSDEAFAELQLSVREAPESFLTHPDDIAFRRIADALERYDRARIDDDMLDDEGYLKVRDSAFERLRLAMQEVLELDPENVDARLILIQISDFDSENYLDALCELDATVSREAGPLQKDRGREAVFDKPRLRLRAAIARAYFDTARYRLAATCCEELLDLDPADEQGARHTLALVYARLEDETAFEELWNRFERRGNAWFYLAHAVLLYKADRLPAATRAIKGFSDLCRGGAFCLLHPAYVDVYIPDRPAAAPGSFEEVLLAVHEADPLIGDTPDFCGWARSIPQIAEASERFAREQGFDW